MVSHTEKLNYEHLTMLFFMWVQMMSVISHHLRVLSQISEI